MYITLHLRNIKPKNLNFRTFEVVRFQKLKTQKQKPTLYSPNENHVVGVEAG